MRIDIGSIVSFTLDEFYFEAPSLCLIETYILDNDNDKLTPTDISKTGVIGFKSSSCSAKPPPVECRTVEFYTNIIKTINFWIHVEGED